MFETVVVLTDVYISEHSTGTVFLALLYQLYKPNRLKIPLTMRVLLVCLR
jgi:hypothetical protein